MTRQLVYVALSRVTSLNGLYIIGNFPGNMKSNNTIALSINEIQRMRKNRGLPLIFNNLTNANGLVMAYLNVQSLKTSLKHILSDKWYTRCHILVLSETCTSSTHDIIIPHFVLLYRSDYYVRPAFVKKNIAKGVMCFVKEGVKAEVVNQKQIFSENNGSYEGHVDLFQIVVDGVSIISGYKSPKAKYLNFERSILEMKTTLKLPTVLIGDMNFNLNDKKNPQVKQFKTLMDTINMKDRMPSNESTTVLDSRLDVIFSDIDDLEAGVYECYFSDHKTIYSILTGLKQSTTTQEEVIIEDADESVDISSPRIGTISTDIICSGESNNLHNVEQVQRMLLPDDMGYSTIEQMNVKLLEHLNNYNDEEVELHLSNCERTLNLIKEFHQQRPGMCLSEEITNFNVELIRNGFKEKFVDGDGNCQFRAISYALTGSEECHGELRALAFDCVWRNKLFFERLQTNPYITDLDTALAKEFKLRELLRICCTDAEWGIKDTLLALSMKMKRIIYVFQTAGCFQEIVKILPAEDLQMRPIVLLLKLDTRHYYAMIPVNEYVLQIMDQLEVTVIDLATIQRQFIRNLIGL